MRLRLYFLSKTRPFSNPDLHRKGKGRPHRHMGCASGCGVAAGRGLLRRNVKKANLD